MNEVELSKFIHDQGLTYEYSYVYESINNETICCVCVDIHPWFKNGAIYIPCFVRECQSVFKIRDRRK